MSLFLLGLFTASVTGQVPKTIAFQGLLTDDQGVPVASGNYSVTFRLYAVESEGSALWTEVQSVNVLDGVGNATLGRINPLILSFDAPYWLGVTLQQGGGELTPRIPLASGPYAFMAQNVPDGSITEAKIADGAVTTSKIQAGGLDGGAISDGAITPGKLADGAITSVKMGENAVNTATIVDGSVTDADLAEGAVTLPKLSITGATNGQSIVFNGTDLVWGAPSGSGVISEIESGAGLTGGGSEGIVTLAVDNDAITAALIAEDAVGNSELANNAVDTDNIIDGAVTKEKLDRGTATDGDVLMVSGAGVVWGAPSVPNGSVTESKIADAAVTAAKIGPGAVGSDKLASAAVESIHISSNAVTTAKLADNTVTGVKIDASSASVDDVLRFSGSAVEWGAVAVADGSISTDKLANGAVTADKIAIASIGADQIAASSVGTSQVSDGAITNAKIGGFISLDKLTTVGADDGDVLGFSGGVASWIPEPVPTETGNLTVSGDLNVTGNLSKGGGTFKIDHPTDPENKFLFHSFVESDEMMNVYSGNVELSEDGSAWVDLPDWFENLNKDFRYQLTCIGGYAPVFVSQPVADGRFQISGGQPNLMVSWQITGVRNDPWAQKNRMNVEVEKVGDERGKLIHPDVYEK